MQIFRVKLTARGFPRRESFRVKSMVGHSLEAIVRDENPSWHIKIMKKYYLVEKFD